ncbi:hypothetical protein EZL74_02090 [Flavobacterium silvisoli]|uniref:DUF4595 domain-containing protein n=1 Tax=Flavobacterium silvisoli TaxID=2529433 RepID=A0A4Q9ZAR1_9FLAO|nr:hypothetical protein [Flavobacterium silvisoli]TBX71319.1 hypothetical protein EZL74_02090 [Flavobacterium silvisoli]
MKRLVLLCMFFVLFQSCSSDDGSTAPDAILVKKIVDTNPAGTFTYNYTYNGNKMAESVLSTTNYIRRAVYTYTGDLITKVEFFDISNTLTERDIYTFNTYNRLATSVKLDYYNETGTKEIYTYNSDGTISTIKYSGDLSTQDNVMSHNTITMNNGEISSRIEDTGAVIKVSSYIYDTKNNPFKNVIGFDQNKHNILQSTYSENGGTVYTTNQQYTYNSNDFPVTHTAGSSTDSVLHYYY